MTTQAKRQKRAWACMHAFEFILLTAQDESLVEKIRKALPAAILEELDAAFPSSEDDENGIRSEEEEGPD
jgi:hypothetical protein